jgi:hypothetical protein
MSATCAVDMLESAKKYVSADPEGDSRIILDIQEPYYREIGELLVNDAIVIRATLEHRYDFFVACATPNRPTTMRAVPL